MIEDQLIKVNGEVVTQRRKKIYPGDIIEIIDSGQWEVQREFGE